MLKYVFDVYAEVEIFINDLKETDLSAKTLSAYKEILILFFF